MRKNRDTTKKEQGEFLAPTLQISSITLSAQEMPFRSEPLPISSSKFSRRRDCCDVG
jgi:hypothetical protein